MPRYVIIFNVRSDRDYGPLLMQLRKWECIPLHESYWLAQLRGPAAAIRNALEAHLDTADALVVLELKSGFDWACNNVLPNGAVWMMAHSP